MPGCPQCQRPIAMLRASCLYCGAPLRPEDVEAAVRSAEPAPEAAPGGDRLLVIADLGAVELGIAAEALSASAFDVQQWARRGNLHLHRIAPRDVARAEAERLTRAGLPAHLVSEAAVRAAGNPRGATAGALAGSSVRLRVVPGGRRL